MEDVTNQTEIDREISKPFTLDILRLCDGNHSISDISGSINLTYKSTFLRIKRLQNLGIIIKKNSGKIGDASKLSLSPKYAASLKLQSLINHFKTRENQFKKILSDSVKQRVIIDILKDIRANRFIDRLDLVRIMNDVYKKYNLNIIDFLEIEHKLKEVGFIKERFEITRKGIKFLESNKS